MTDDSNSNTRPISVAELLAKNGTIGAPPVGGRRRRRRGNADAVTVAELTGEIPIIRPDDPPPAPAPEKPAAPVEEPVDEAVEAYGAPPAADETPSTNGFVEHDVEPETDEAAAEDDGTVEDEADDDYADAVAAYAARVEQRGTDEEVDADEEADAGKEVDAGKGVDADKEAETPEVEPTRRFGFGRFGRKNPEVDAEKWTPDPVVGSGDATEVTDELDEPLEVEALDAEAAVEAERDGSLSEVRDDPTDDDTERDELPSYLRSTEEPLFGGHSVADDALRGDRTTVKDDRDHKDLRDDGADDEGDDFDAAQGEPRTMSPAVHGLWIVGQSVIAVVFGAGLFVAFDQLWKWNNIVALVLSVLVILGLVVGVRVVRKTEDIVSTLIAVAVGALVTLGPLALLQSG